MKRYARNFPAISKARQKSLATRKILIVADCFSGRLTAELLVRTGVTKLHFLCDDDDSSFPPLISRLYEICGFGDFQTVKSSDFVSEDYDLAVLPKKHLKAANMFKNTVVLKGESDPTIAMAQCAVTAEKIISILSESKKSGK